MHAPSVWPIGVHTAGSKTRATRTERWHAIEVQTRMEICTVLHPASQLFIHPHGAAIATVCVVQRMGGCLRCPNVGSTNPGWCVPMLWLRAYLSCSTVAWRMV